jgi:hypothetical protein
MDNILELYIKAINEVDDYFEYRCESKKDQKKVHDILEQLTKELSEVETDE